MNMGGRAYPVRHYPLAMRLRTRKGCAILCIALFPQSGDSSGAILGVRSVALLHSRSSQGCRSVKLSILWRNEKRRNLKKTHFCITNTTQVCIH